MFKSHISLSQKKNLTLLYLKLSGFGWHCIAEQ